MGSVEFQAVDGRVFGGDLIECEEAHVEIFASRFQRRGMQPFQDAARARGLVRIDSLRHALGVVHEHRELRAKHRDFLAPLLRLGQHDHQSNQGRDAQHGQRNGSSTGMYPAMQAPQNRARNGQRGENEPGDGQHGMEHKIGHGALSCLAP